MSIIQEEDNYLAPEIRLAFILSNLDNIFENYQKFIPQKFPDQNKQNLKQLIQEIFTELDPKKFQSVNNINEKYKSLSKQLTDFSDEIKKISYENEYYEKIKKTNDDLINLNQEINKILIKNSESLSGIYDFKKDDQEDLYNCGNSSIPHGRCRWSGWPWDTGSEARSHGRNNRSRRSCSGSSPPPGAGTAGSPPPLLRSAGHTPSSWIHS